jgi:hypothetical protein
VTAPAKKRRAREGWTRLGTEGKLGAVYVHDASGWVIRHCGHPTANWPYYGEHPKLLRPGEMLTSGGVYLGYAFRTVLDAQLVVEHLHAGGHLHTPRCVRDDQLACGHPSYFERFRNGGRS